MFRSPSTRRMAPVVLLAAVALLLSGCGDSSKKDEKPTKASTPAAGSCDYKSGDTSDKVKVTGEFGKKLTADFSKLKATGLQRTILKKGDGDTTATGDKVEVVITAFLGSDGKSLTSQPTQFAVGDGTVPPAFDAAVSCVPIGSRVAVSIPAKDLVGAAGNPQLGVKASDTLVIVADVVSKVVPPKLPKPAVWSDAPKVTFAANGTPKVTLTGKPSPRLELKVLKKGTGAVVQSGDTVTVNYQGTNWNTKKIFDQSYGKAPATFTTDGVVAGFGAALVGQKVGTKLIVTIPSKYGYGANGNEAAGIKGTDTLVFVIEIQNTSAVAATPPAN